MRKSTHSWLSGIISWFAINYRLTVPFWLISFRREQFGASLLGISFHTAQ